MANNTPPRPGFTLPQPATDTGTAAETLIPPTITINPVLQGPSPQDILVGSAVLLLLMVAFFFAKNAYATMLVGKRVQPRSANAAAWWLWVFLTLLTAGVVLAVVSRSILMTPFIVGPLVLGALLALVLMIKSSRG